MKHTLAKRTTSLMIVAIMMIGMCLTAFAVTESEMITSVEKYLNSNAKIDKSDANNVKVTGLTSAFADKVTADITTGTAWTSYGYITLSGSGDLLYYKKDTTSLTAMYSAVQRNSTSADVMTKIDEVTDAYSIEADIQGAAGMASGFIPVISTGLGILCWVIILGQMLYTAFDMCYLTIPAFQSFAEDVREGGASFGNETFNSVGVKENKDGTRKIRFITNEAIYAYKKSNTSETGKSPWGIYMWKRAWSFIATAFVLYIFFSGNITLLVRIGLNWLEGIMQMLKSWG